jgi:hypothetical protein
MAFVDTDKLGITFIKLFAFQTAVLLFVGFLLYVL